MIACNSALVSRGSRGRWFQAIGKTVFVHPEIALFDHSKVFLYPSFRLKILSLRLMV